MLTRLFRFRSFISICRVHPFALALVMTRSVSRSSALCTSRKLGVGAEVRTIQTRIRMGTWPGNHRNRAVTVGQGLSEHVAREPTQITCIERPFFRHHFAGYIDQRSLQVLGEFVPHRCVMDVCVPARHLWPEMA